MIDINSVFDNFPTLETERLILRELSLDDIHEIREMNRDEDILKHMHYGVRYDALDTLTNLIKLSAYKEVITWGITLRESNELIGIRQCFIDLPDDPVTIQG